MSPAQFCCRRRKSRSVCFPQPSAHELSDPWPCLPVKNLAGFQKCTNEKAGRRGQTLRYTSEQKPVLNHFQSCRFFKNSQSVNATTAESEKRNKTSTESCLAAVTWPTSPQRRGGRCRKPTAISRESHLVEDLHNLDFSKLLRLTSRPMKV